MTVFVGSGRNDAACVHVGQDPVAGVGSDARRMFCRAGHAEPAVAVPRPVAQVRVAAAAFLMRKAAQGGAASGIPMSTMADHIAYNPLLVVQRRLGLASLFFARISPRVRGGNSGLVDM